MYIANLSKKHWEAVKSILRYLNGINDLCIFLGRKDTYVFGYANADFARNVDNMSSVIGYVLSFTKGANSWVSALYCFV